jgi:hypothetical protein
MKSFRINFPSIALIPVALFFMFLLTFWISDGMFVIEAHYQGYDVADDMYEIGNHKVMKPDQARDGSCYVMENSTKTFCKSDYGMMGWKQWFTTSEHQQIIDKFPTVQIEPDNQVILQK